MKIKLYIQLISRLTWQSIPGNTQFEYYGSHSLYYVLVQELNFSTVSKSQTTGLKLKFLRGIFYWPCSKVFTFANTFVGDHLIVFIGRSEFGNLVGILVLFVIGRRMVGRFVTSCWRSSPIWLTKLLLDPTRHQTQILLPRSSTPVWILNSVSTILYQLFSFLL